MAEKVGITKFSDKFVAAYRDKWLPEVGITKLSTRERLTEEFRSGQIEITSEMREKLKSP